MAEGDSSGQHELSVAVARGAVNTGYICNLHRGGSCKARARANTKADLGLREMRGEMYLMMSNVSITRMNESHG